MKVKNFQSASLCLRGIHKLDKPSFFKGVKTEFKKISWPDRDSLLKQSIAVVCISLVLGVVIAILDFLMQYGVDFLVNL